MNEADKCRTYILPTLKASGWEHDHITAAVRCVEDITGRYGEKLFPPFTCTVLNTITYHTSATLIIDPAMKKHNKLRLIKAQRPEVISGKDFLDKGKA